MTAADLIPGEPYYVLTFAEAQQRALTKATSKGGR